MLSGDDLAAPPRHTSGDLAEARGVVGRRPRALKAAGEGGGAGPGPRGAPPRAPVAVEGSLQDGVHLRPHQHGADRLRHVVRVECGPELLRPAAEARPVRAAKLDGGFALPERLEEVWPTGPRKSAVSSTKGTS